MTKRAQKFDAGKVQLEYLSPVAIEMLGQVLTFGVQKYAPHNWRHGMEWSRVLGALLRHTFAWARGQSLDEETGLSHMAHVMCCAMFLVEYEALGIGTDDCWRPAGGSE